MNAGYLSRGHDHGGIHRTVGRQTELRCPYLPVNYTTLSALLERRLQIRQGLRRVGPSVWVWRATIQSQILRIINRLGACYFTLSPN